MPEPATNSLEACNQIQYLFDEKIVRIAQVPDCEGQRSKLQDLDRQLKRMNLQYHPDRVKEDRYFNDACVRIQTLRDVLETMMSHYGEDLKRHIQKQADNVQARKARSDQQPCPGSRVYCENSGPDEPDSKRRKKSVPTKDFTPYKPWDRKLMPKRQNLTLKHQSDFKKLLKIYLLNKKKKIEEFESKVASLEKEIKENKDKANHASMVEKCNLSSRISEKQEEKKKIEAELAQFRALVEEGCEFRVVPGPDNFYRYTGTPIQTLLGNCARSGATYHDYGLEDMLKYPRVAGEVFRMYERISARLKSKH